MNSHILRDDADLKRMHGLVARLPGGSTVADLDELLLQPAIRARTRLWLRGGQAVAFALVDDYNNLHFDLDPRHFSAQTEAQIVEWGLTCMSKRNAATDRQDTLDASCDAANAQRIALLERHGFACQPVRSLHYARALEGPLPHSALPHGFWLRPVHGEDEVEALVNLHRAAFGTENMTVEQRLAIMRAPQYDPQLDLVAVALSGELAAFCVCGLEGPLRQVGYTDPLGTHARYQRRGLGRAVLSAGLRALRGRGATRAELGSSSDSVAMQRLADVMGFHLISESLWFSRTVS